MEKVARKGGSVVAVASDAEHRFSKLKAQKIELIAGFGVSGDAHSGRTIQHLWRVAVDPSQPNLRQVHLIPAELFAELAGRGFTVSPGDLGENIVTKGIDLVSLPQRTRMMIGRSAVLEITGLRNPCRQIEKFQPGLLAAVLDKAPDGTIIRKAGIMAIVVHGGLVKPKDAITFQFPGLPHLPLERV